MKFKAVSHRLICWTLSASAAIFIVIAYYDYSNTKAFLNEQIKNEANLARADMLQRVHNLLHSVSRSTDVTAKVLPIAKSKPAVLEKLLRTLLNEHDEIYGMAVALEPKNNDQVGYAPYYYHDRANDNRLIRIDLSQDKYNYREQSWYRDAVDNGEARWSEPYFDEDGGNIAMVTYSAPIYLQVEQQQKLIGVVTADIALDYINHIVSDLAIGQSGFAYIVTNKGNIITHSNPDMIMTSLNPQTNQQSSTHANLFQNILDGKSDTLQVPCRDIKNGQYCWMSYQPIAGTHWSIAIVVPMQELVVSLEQYQTNALIITFAGLSLLAIVIIMLSRKLTQPLLALSQSTQSLAEGNFDTEISDFKLQDEVGTLARQFQSMQRSLKEYIQRLNLETAQRERIEGELSAAHNIQMQMLPNQGHSNIQGAGWQLSATLEPAKSVGGDLYHYQLLGDGKLFFAIGDVSDKGVAAAIFMAKTQTLLRQYCSSTPTPTELLTIINTELCQDNESCMFVTMICGIFDSRNGELLLASAGHNAPLLADNTPLATDTLSATNNSHFLTLNTGPALGFYEDASFAVSQYTLNKGCALVLTTDGVDEANNLKLEEYGEARLQQCITSTHNSNSQITLENLLKDVLDFRGEAEQSDDLTIMILHRD